MLLNDRWETGVMMHDASRLEMENRAEQKRLPLVCASTLGALKLDVAKCGSRSETDSSDMMFSEAAMEPKPFSDAGGCFRAMYLLLTEPIFRNFRYFVFIA